MDDIATKPDPPFIWCLVANVTRKPHTEGSDELRLGTKRFSPGAKLYCCPSEWGDGWERLRVLGRHRGGGPRLIETIVATKRLTNWRAQKVYHPHVVEFMTERWMWDSSDESQRVANSMADSLLKRTSPDPPAPASSPGNAKG